MSEHPSAARDLQKLRQNIVALKDDRSTYIKTTDVLRYYGELTELLRAHEEYFGDAAVALETGSGSTKSLIQLESEHLLEDCFRLISLLYLTIGRNSEPPATYAPCAIIKRLISHLAESGNFSNKDLAPVHEILRKYKDITGRNVSTDDLRVISFLDAQISSCLIALKPLQEYLDEISPQLLGVLERLVSLRRCIKAAESRKRFSESDVRSYLDQVKEIDASRVDGKFVGDDGSTPNEGQAEVQLVLERSYLMADEALKRQGAIAPGLSHIADKLFRIKYRLEKLELTQSWSLRETDLFDFTGMLSEIDDQRVGGKFIAEDGTSPEEGQSIILYLLRRSYAHVYTLIISSEPVSEALAPIFNQLQTVRRCLQEVQKFGIQDARELYPYSLKLNSIESMRVDGKFMIGDEIPEGQGRVVSLLAECFEICQDLRVNSGGSDEE